MMPKKYGSFFLLTLQKLTIPKIIASIPKKQHSGISQKDAIVDHCWLFIPP